MKKTLTAFVIACVLTLSSTILAVFTDDQGWALLILLSLLGLSIEGIILILNT